MATVCAACVVGRHDQCSVTGIVPPSCGCPICWPAPKEEKAVEHHWHEPSRGAVMKALLQHLNDMGYSKEHIATLVDKKVETAVSERMAALLASGKLETLVVNAVAVVALGERKLFDKDKGGNGYEWHNRVRNLVNEKVKEICTNEYEVIIRKREKPNAG